MEHASPTRVGAPFAEGIYWRAGNPRLRLALNWRWIVAGQ